MKKTKMYRYLGRNGIITSPILLENQTPIQIFSLVADEGKILTDGTRNVFSTMAFEDELDNWVEIEEEGNTN